MASADHLDARTELYVREVLEAIDTVVPLREAYLVGSGATGGFDPATSDVDLVGVVETPLGPRRDPLVRRLLEEPCPVRDLELVLYVVGAEPPHFELNVSHAEERPDDEGFWFVIDAALAQESAVPVWGDQPWSDSFAPVPPAGLRRALLESIAWSDRHGSEFARMNARRAQHYLDHGDWISKQEVSA